MLQKINLYCFRVFEKIKENRNLGDLYCYSFLSFTKSFPKHFSLSFCFLNSKFSTLELYFLSYSIRIFVLWKEELFEVVETSKCCTLLVFVVSLFGRG